MLWYCRKPFVGCTNNVIRTEQLFLAESKSRLPYNSINFWALRCNETMTQHSFPLHQHFFTFVATAMISDEWTRLSGLNQDFDCIINWVVKTQNIGNEIYHHMFNIYIQCVRLITLPSPPSSIIFKRDSIYNFFLHSQMQTIDKRKSPC